MTIEEYFADLIAAYPNRLADDSLTSYVNSVIAILQTVETK